MASKNIMTQLIKEIPLLLAGPILRRCTPEQVVFWFATSSAAQLQLHSDYGEQASLRLIAPDETEQQVWQVGKNAYIYGFIWSPKTPLPQSLKIHYNFTLGIGKNQYTLAELTDELCYTGHTYPSFVIDLTIKELMHGSCRKPHHDSDDALVQLDNTLAERIAQQAVRPSYLMMSGDQVYTDDVAGPLLHAIHQVIEQLGLFNEKLTDSVITHSNDLLSNQYSFYQRDQLLPDDENNAMLKHHFWKGKRKPIFTSANSDNHLISFGEMMAMYLLTWSPALWANVSLDKPNLAAEFHERYAEEKSAIQHFAQGLGQVRRVMAHLPCYMIFDDHDITDDWNLNREWEEACYGNAFSKKIIGNALLAYLLCQGWGNDPKRFTPLLKKLEHCFDGAPTLCAE